MGESEDLPSLNRTQSNYIEILRLKMSTDPAWKCSCDIEVCFPGAPFGDSESIVGSLSEEFSLENKVSRGWGPTISLVESWEGDRREISSALVRFIKSIHHAILLLQTETETIPCLRIGLYFSSLYFTWTLESAASELIAEIGAQLEISFYPGEMDD